MTFLRVMLLPIILIWATHSCGQDSCATAKVYLHKAWDGKANVYRMPNLKKAYALCPGSSAINTAIAQVYVGHNTQASIAQSLPYLDRAIALDETNRKAREYRAAVSFGQGDFSKAREDYAVLLELTESTQQTEMMYRTLLAYMDTVEYLGAEALEKHRSENYKPRRIVGDTFALNLFKRDPFVGYAVLERSDARLHPNREVLMYRIGLRGGIRGLANDAPEDPYAQWYNAEEGRTKSDHWFADKHKPYPSNGDFGEYSYDRAAKGYARVIAVVPDHLPSLMHLADIHYIDERYDSSIYTFKRILTVLPSDQQTSQPAMQARRMLRRIEWLKTFDGAIKKNTLYWDQGRLSTAISAVGELGNVIGNAVAMSQGDIGYAYAGLAANYTSLAITKARLSTKWFWEFHKNEKWSEMYDKCLNQLPRHLNNSGFYSEETMQMLCGVLLGGAREHKLPEYVHHVRALVDVVFISKTDRPFYLSTAMLGGLLLLKADKELSCYERFKLVNVIYHFEELYKQTKGEPWLKPERIELLEEAKAAATKEIQEAAKR